MPEVPTEAVSSETKPKDQKRFVVTGHRKSHEKRHTNKLYRNVQLDPRFNAAAR